MYNANPNYEMDFMILKDVNELNRPGNPGD